MKCCLSNCPNDPVVLVHFLHHRNPYPYCERHAGRWSKVDGSWKQLLAWKRGVRSVEPITQGEAHDGQDE